MAARASAAERAAVLVVGVLGQGQRSAPAPSALAELQREGRLAGAGAAGDADQDGHRARIIIAASAMALLRALAYFVEEALTSLWRSRLINALSVGTIAVSLFVLGAFLTVASNLNEVVDALDPEGPGHRSTSRTASRTAIRESLENRLREDPAVEALVLVTRERGARSASAACSATCARCPTTWARTRSRPRSR